MKVHYIYILLFAFPLNILITLYHVYNQMNHKSTTHHTPKVPTTRLLCECNLYIPNYDNDPEMKRVMQQFDDRTSQRFHEYDKRMIEKQQKCKDQCDKEIQKIILKDKLEKELMDKFATLQTDIQNDAIPTCFCEKSLAGKTENFCLNCGKTMGAVAPAWGLLSGLGYAGWSQYVATTVAKAATDAGMNVVIEVLKKLGAEKVTAVIFEEISRTGQYANIINFATIINTELKATCAATSSSTGANQAMDTSICMLVKNGTTPGSTVENFVLRALKTIVKKAPQAAEAKAVEVTANYTSTTSSLTTAITASIITIVVIVLIMVIIYLILRYRRKKKMKKKLQYIKLLEE